jgi:nucleoside-diphosphate-sugar epimerase
MILRTVCLKRFGGKMMAKKVMIVGGSGNISTAVTALLLKKGYEVSVFARGQNFIKPHPRARIVRGDRRNREQYIRTMREGRYDFAIDMIGFTREDAEDDYVAFTEVERLVFTSSGAGYGDLVSRELPIREDFTGSNLHWAYGVGKKAAENFLMGKFLETGYPVTIIRPTVTYGRQKTIVRQIGMDNAWIDRIRKGKPIVTGNPYILRNFLYADDAAYAYTGAIEHDVCIGQSYNMVGLKPYDWGAYHRAMMTVLDREVEMVEIPLDTLLAMQGNEFHVDEMITTNFKYNGFYSGEKIARDIPEFRERTSLIEGLSKTIEFLDQYKCIPNSDDLPYEDVMIRAQLDSRKRHW